MPRWGHGYFSVNERGHVAVMPQRDPERAIDLHELIEGLRERDLHTPVLIRFSDILADRIREIHAAFDAAIADQNYQGDYRCVYPIKVNQQKHVLEEIRDLGADYGIGLEAGSKPELLAVLGETSNRPETPIICNGFKDDEFIEMVILATKLGRVIIPVVEKFSELELIIKHAERYGVRPRIGVRVKLSSAGAGRWGASAGARSKFGLFLSEALEALERLKERGMAECLTLLHCHIGSQISDIRSLKSAVSELAHVYTELRRLGAGVTMLDVGGGLGVDYDGSQSATDSSINYSIEEYASDVVYRVKAACDEAGAPHPTIITESGRAIVAYSSALVFNVLDVARYDQSPSPEQIETDLPASEPRPQPILDLLETRRSLADEDLVEAHHDAMQAREELTTLFTMGYISLPMRAMGERLFWSIGREILDRASRRGPMPDEFASLAEIFSDIYFCNFSIFQSLPDAWAIDQLFPICPIHRLDERPSRRGVLADITCDSDGTIDRFVGAGETRRALDLHPHQPDEPYYLAAFLVGAYQEILGDLHNLLGDTHAVHVRLDEHGEAIIEEIIRGDTVSTALGYVQINHQDLRRSMRREVERAVRSRRLSVPESQSLMRFFTSGLNGYTYLEDESPPSGAAAEAIPDL